MLLSARLFRSTTRPFKTFPGSRLGEPTSTLLPSDGKPRKELEASQIQEASIAPTVSFPQLEVNTSNLKFRKSKKKDREMEALISDTTAMEEAQADPSGLLLLPGSRKSDFEKWLESRASEVDTEGMPEKKVRHDSVISSCNASDCSEEDCKVSEKMLEEEEEACIHHGECRSMTTSSSGVASDSEGVSPTCGSPDGRPREVEMLHKKLDMKMIGLASTRCEGDSIFTNPEPEVQFQVVQNKKKMKLKSKSNERRDEAETKHSNIVPNDRSVVDSKQSKKRRNIPQPSNRPTESSVPSVSESLLAAPKENSDVIPQPNSTDVSALATKSVLPESPRQPLSVEQESCKSGRCGLKSGKKIKKGANAAPTNVDLSDAKVPRVESKTSQLFHIQSGRSSPPTSAVEKVRPGDSSISFGSGCKDLDVFGSPLSVSSLERPGDASERKVEGTSTESCQWISGKLSDKRQFNLKEAQLFLLQAYNAVEKQRIKDSSSVFIYS